MSLGMVIMRKLDLPTGASLKARVSRPLGRSLMDRSGVRASVRVGLTFFSTFKAVVAKVVVPNDVNKATAISFKHRPASRAAR